MSRVAVTSPEVARERSDTRAGVTFLFVICIAVSYIPDFAVCAWFHGVVGYHVRLTRERSPVQARMQPHLFVYA